MKTRKIGLALLIGLCAVPVAWAVLTIGDVVEVYYEVLSPHVNIPGLWGAGLFQLKVDGAPMTGFCIGLQQTASHAPHLYTVVPLAGAPDPGGPMGNAAAMGIMKVWSWWKASPQDALSAATAQVVIWELTDDGNFDTGLLVLPSGAVRTSAEALWAALPTLTDYTPMVALTSPDYQDFAVPNPTRLVTKDLVATRDADGDGIVEVGEVTQFDLLITVANCDGEDAMTNIVVKDHFGADLEVVNPTALAPSQGTAVITTSKGKSAQNRLTWNVGTLAPGGWATLLVTVVTDINPGGKQEYTSPGEHTLNSGANVKGILRGEQVSATSDSITINVELPDEAG